MRHKFSSVLMVAMPFILIVFLGSQMALKQVERKSRAYMAMPEVTQVAALKELPPETVLMLRGRISAVANLADEALTVYQERPADGRDVRFRETFDQHFPELELALSDGRVRIIPGEASAYVIQHTHHEVTRGDRQLSGFRPGDMVTVQGRWRPGEAELPRLMGVTGITGIDKAGLLAEWQIAVRNVKWVSRLAGLLTALSTMILILRMRQRRSLHRAEEETIWPIQTTPDVPATSLS